MQNISPVLLLTTRSSCSFRFSSVLGDPFHFMDRAKVRMHHGSKKGYYVALRRA